MYYLCSTPTWKPFSNSEAHFKRQYLFSPYTRISIFFKWFYPECQILLAKKGPSQDTSNADQTTIALALFSQPFVVPLPYCFSISPQHTLRFITLSGSFTNNTKSRVAKKPFPCSKLPLRTYHFSPQAPQWMCHRSHINTEKSNRYFIDLKLRMKMWRIHWEYAVLNDFCIHTL